jgi:hypothetical protein
MAEHTHDPATGVKLRIESTGIASIKPQTVFGLLLSAVERCGCLPIPCIHQIQHCLSYPQRYAEAEAIAHESDSDWFTFSFSVCDWLMLSCNKS